ncbi:hypothetical protein E2C01_035116 [Portunus trituberculatus]|uniref:Uncharacterized protein n=1 Tax=Portunus trituberculatus TaxID=210409 RepID=A0A5B7F2B8_PORTR|nr:hypothetical protein [Portunus trituberculatus]
MLPSLETIPTTTPLLVKKDHQIPKPLSPPTQAYRIQTHLTISSASGQTLHVLPQESINKKDCKLGYPAARFRPTLDSPKRRKTRSATRLEATWFPDGEEGAQCPPDDLIRFFFFRVKESEAGRETDSRTDTRKKNTNCGNGGRTVLKPEESGAAGTKQSLSGRLGSREGRAVRGPGTDNASLTLAAACLHPSAACLHPAARTNFSPDKNG